MLRSLEIQNFKGIKQGKIGDLAQVNILVGRNNSGKSTILDALILLRSAFIARDYLDQPGPLQILVRRVDRGTKNPSYDELWHRMNTDVPLRLSVELGTSTSLVQEWTHAGGGPLQARTIIKNGARDYTWISYGDTGVAKKHKDESNWKELKNQFGEELATFLGLIHILDPHGTHFPYAERIWPELMNDRLDIKVTGLLNEIYGTDIEYLSFMPHPSEVRLVAAVPHTGLAVDWLGDGFRYAVNILALGVVLQGTALLVEELETHQHPESLRKLTETLFELAKQQDLQLFLTTHSIELINCALEAAEEKEVDLKLHHLDLNQEGTMSAIPMTQPSAKLLLDVGHDPRMHYKYVKAP